ncbi:DUF3299 domain-containing protein [Aquisalimonas asiatica]|uniref:DUF3299 domain-containing protein n=1 Tax=Aquisalimonas asiatica TaxID=406100 RepID=A0A1H8PPC6_9GAMM|nr:DUF3299 domain-containing protein [Aquisalimonas asiatica]SEO43765.1 Protein of unknown function [Aquisalimonas asiatica]
MTVRLPILTLIAAVAVALAACGGDEPEVDTGSDAPAVTSGEEDNIRVYMSGMDEFGEVAGLTTSSDDVLELTLALHDDDGAPMADETLEVSSLVGNELSDSTLLTNDEGQAELRLRPALPGQDTLTITGGGSSRQLSVYVSDESYGHPLEPMEERAQELPEVDGAVSWDLISSVETREGASGMLEPLFDDDIRALDGEEVKLQGFMMPLDNSERQRHFLVSRTPPSCFFCLPGGPETVVEVELEESLAFTFDPILLSGRMRLMENSDMGLFYRLDDAELQEN